MNGLVGMPFPFPVDPFGCEGQVSLSTVVLGQGDFSFPSEATLQCLIKTTADSDGQGEHF